MSLVRAKGCTATAGAFFASAPYHDHDDPFERLIGYIEFRKAIIEGDLAEFTCLVGTMTQEVYGSNPAIRDACAASIFGHAATLEPDIEAAMKARGIAADWTRARPSITRDAICCSCSKRRRRSVPRIPEEDHHMTGIPNPGTKAISGIARRSGFVFNAPRP